MSNIAIFVPRQDMLDKVRQVVETDHIDLQQMKVIETPNAVNEARLAITKGAGIIIARGIQALLIKRHTNVPVVEIRLSGQELGLLIVKAKKLAGKLCPHIALIGFQNQFDNMDHFGELFHIHFHAYFPADVTDIPQAVECAAKEGAEVVIGGDTVNQIARNLKIPSIFMESGEESIRTAIAVARRIEYASDIEKQNRAQLKTILDTSFGGIVKIDSQHRIMEINSYMEEFLHKPRDEFIGQPIENLLTGIDRGQVDRLLTKEQEWVTTTIRIGGQPLMVMASTIECDDKVNGAFFSLLRMTSDKLPSDNLREMYLNGYFAHSNFEHIERSSPEMEKCIELAKSYALTKNPVLIYGETGTETDIFAQAIHNNSSRKNQPFVAVTCIPNDPDIYRALFGDVDSDNKAMLSKGAMVSANYGTVYIRDIENIPLKCQERLLKTIQQNAFTRSEAGSPLILNTRIIASSHRDLIYLVKNGTFLEELYYILTPFSLKLPPLRRNPGAIRPLAERYIRDSSSRYCKYPIISEEAWKRITGYSWEGNLLQLKYFCDRLVLTATKRVIREDYVEGLLAEAYPALHMRNGEETVILYKYPQAAKIADLMKKYAGNRTRVAKELGISTTTLWRYIKKFGVNTTYDF